MDWSGCELVEIVPGKVFGAPLIVGTSISADAIVENYEAFLEEGIRPEEAIDGTFNCYPGAGALRIRDLLAYYYAHEAQLQP
jgi:uncharacterized protein (DUF433 family)